MDLLISPAFLRVLLLVVLFAPLGFAAAVALAGDRFRPARRTAGLLAVLHLAATLFLVAVTSLYSAAQDSKYAGGLGFRPIAVPGDTASGDLTLGGGQQHRTTWNLFVVGKADPNFPNVQPAVQFFIGLDGLNVWLVLLTSLMTYVAVALSWHSAKEKAGGYYAWVFVLQSAVTGAFVSFDVLLFYLFFELTLIPTFFLIGGWGIGGGKRDAARKFFLYTLLGSLFSLVGIIGIVYTNPTFMESKPAAVPVAHDPAIELHHGPVSFDVNQLMQNVQLRQNAHLSRAHMANELADRAAAELETARKQKADNLSAYETKAAAARKLADDTVAARDGYKSTQLWLFFALIAGFVVKVPLVPFHTWLPGAYAEAPAPITMLLSALLAKLGTLGMMRIVIPLCADAAVQYGLPVFGTLGAIGIVYAAFCAFAQKDIKLMAAYSSVSHLGLLVLGMFALNGEGLTGAALHMVNHGLSAGAMFALLAFLYDRYRTTDMTQLGGLWAKYPKWTFFLMVVCLASVGLPGLNNFVSEMMLIGGLFTPWPMTTVGPWLAVAAAAGILLSAWYTFTMLKQVAFGPLKEPTNLPDGVMTGDLTGRELWALALPALGCLLLGLFPQPVIYAMRYDVGVVEAYAHRARERINRELADKEEPVTQPKDEPPEAPAEGNAGPGPFFGPGGGPPGPPPIPPPPRQQPMPMPK